MESHLEVWEALLSCSNPVQALEGLSTRSRKSPRQTEHRTGEALPYPNMCCTRAMSASTEGSGAPVLSLSMWMETRLDFTPIEKNVYANGSNFNDFYDRFFERRINLISIRLY